MPELPQGGVRSGPDSAGDNDAAPLLGGNLRGKLREIKGNLSATTTVYIFVAFRIAADALWVIRW